MVVEMVKESRFLSIGAKPVLVIRQVTVIDIGEFPYALSREEVFITSRLQSKRPLLEENPKFANSQDESGF
jgi:hypothetical protein